MTVKAVEVVNQMGIIVNSEANNL
jgi:hypothetical protein